MSSAGKLGSEWGPILWKLFHTLAEWSDRRDIVYRWKRVMDLTSTTLPCETCRRHMQLYLRSHSIFVRSADSAPKPAMRRVRGVAVQTSVKGWIPATGLEVKYAVRKGIWKFHNHVNASIGITELSEEEAYKLYEFADRSAACKTVREWIVQLDTIWKGHSEWRNELVALLALIESGPY